MPWTSIVFTFFVLFVAAFIKAIFGFGESLLAMPLLTLILGIQTATPLVGLVALSLTFALLYQGWQRIDFRSAWRIMLAAVLGLPLGIWGLRILPGQWITLGLGVVLVSVGTYNLVRPGIALGIGPRWAYLFGFVGGILGGAYNTGGPPIVMYGTLRRWPTGQFQATLQGCFLPLSLLTALGHGLAGLWTGQVLQLYGLSLPVVIAALWVGGRVGPSLAGRHFERLIYIGLIVLGVRLLI